MSSVQALQVRGKCPHGKFYCGPVHPVCRHFFSRWLFSDCHLLLRMLHNDFVLLHLIRLKGLHYKIAKRGGREGCTVLFLTTIRTPLLFLQFSVLNLKGIQLLFLYFVSNVRAGSVNFQSCSNCLWFKDQRSQKNLKVLFVQTEFGLWGRTLESL